jgi:hypothetical protein
MSAVGLGPATAASRRQLRARVDTFATARRRVGAIDGASRGLIVGCVIAAVAGLVSRFVVFDGGVALAALLLIGSTVTAAALGWFQPVADDRVALDIDRQLGLAERVTTALELDRLTDNRGGITPKARASRQVATPTGHLDLADEQIADALTYLAAARTGQVYPIRHSRRRSIVLLLGVMLAIAPWVVAWPTLLGSRLPVSRTAAVQQAESARLDAVATRLENDGTPTDRQLRGQIAAQLRQAAATLRQGGGNEQQASKELLRAESAAASLAPQTGEDAALTLSRIADALNADPATQSVTRALDQQDASQTAAALNQVASSLPSMSPDGRRSVAQALQAASDAARGSDTNAADQLQQAAEAAKNGDPSGMQAATQALDQLNQASQAQHDVTQARSEMESSRQAIAQANQNGTTRAGNLGSTSPNPLGQSQPSSASASSAASNQDSQSGSGQSASDAQAGGQSSSSAQGDSANQAGAGSGTGSTQHLGAPHDLQGLAQRQVVVPSSGDGEPGSVSVSNKLQTGSAGSAQVDYSNVLPEYRQQAQQVVDGNVVPTGLKQVVKGYFDALAPK